MGTEFGEREQEGRGKEKRKSGGVLRARKEQSELQRFGEGERK